MRVIDADNLISKIEGELEEWLNEKGEPNESNI